MKKILLFLLCFSFTNSYAQNFTDSQSFIDYLEGDWEKKDSLTINTLYDQNAGNYLRLRFEKIIGSDSSINVSAYGNTYSSLNFSLDCSFEEIGFDTDPLFYSYFLNLHPSNQNLMYRFDSLDYNNLVLKKRIHFWDDYSYIYNFKRVSFTDTLIVGQTCDSSNIMELPVILGCNNDTLYRKNSLKRTLYLEKSSFDTSLAGTVTEHFSSIYDCDSIVVTTTNLLDSNSLYYIKLMHGTWEWVYTHSGWSSSFADSLDYKIKMKIFETETLNDLPYSIYFADTIRYCARYYYLSNFKLADYSMSSNTFYPTTYDILNLGDTIIGFRERMVYDGPTYYWKKISNSTSSNLYIKTCNIEEVGIDTIITNNCDNSLTITNTSYDCPMASESINSEDLNISPNPAKLVVQISIEEEALSVLVFDIEGKKVIIQQNEKMLDVSQLGKGLYFIKVSTVKGVYSSKFVKE
jgi:hypothetical protein